MPLFGVLSCKPVDETRPTEFELSTDTLMFDTVFTTIGSSTQIFKVYNNNNVAMTLDEVFVCGGSNSSYSINVDGTPGDVTNVEIPPHDSIFVFAKVRIDPTNINTPLVVEDSICFSVEDNRKYVKLVAWGQDANYIVADTYLNDNITYKVVAGENESTVWTNEKPYVIYGWAVVDSTGSLTINQGTKVCFHSGGGLWIYKGGNLKVLGTESDRVVFEGDRTEPEWDDEAGQWDRIWINEGAENNEIHYAIIKNGFIGIQTETLQEPMGGILLLDNVEIYNMSGYGIYSVFYGIIGANSIVGDCSAYLMALTLGGYYDFRNCTFANFASSREDASSVYINNYALDSLNAEHPFNLEQAFFGNCIIYGSRDNEVFIDKASSDDYLFNLSFKNSLMRISNDNLETIQQYSEDCIYSGYPVFRNFSTYNYHIDGSASPVVNKGSRDVINESLLPIYNDHDNVSRINDEAPDIGAFEYNN